MKFNKSSRTCIFSRCQERNETTAVLKPYCRASASSFPVPHLPAQTHLSNASWHSTSVEDTSTTNLATECYF